MSTALYLAHLNPVTSSHTEIIEELRSQSDAVIVMPVVFRMDGKEVNSKSFPFSFEARRDMIRAVFDDAVRVSENYTFHAPFSRYMPPLLSPKSWRLRRQILDGIEGDYFTYTGDKTEGYMLKLYRLRPRVGRRKPLSASSVKEMLYDAARGSDPGWRSHVAPGVATVIENNWETVKRFSDADDQTIRVAGMKFPKEGYRFSEID